MCRLLFGVASVVAVCCLYDVVCCLLIAVGCVIVLRFVV